MVIDGGYNIVTSFEKARELIRAYRACGIYIGMMFLPWYKGSEIAK